MVETASRAFFVRRFDFFDMPHLQRPPPPVCLHLPRDSLISLAFRSLFSLNRLPMADQPTQPTPGTASKLLSLGRTAVSLVRTGWALFANLR